MTKTLTEVVAEAHRRINVLSVDESPSADMVTYGGAAAESLLAELTSAPNSMPFTWTTAAVPDAVFRPFSWLLATDLGVHYERPSEPRSRAMARVRGYAFPDDRTDRRDIDSDGVISDAEAAAGDRAAYY